MGILFITTSERTMISMENKKAKEIILDYVFGDYDIKSIYKHLNVATDDPLEKQLYAKALLTEALRTAVKAL